MNAFILDFDSIGLELCVAGPSRTALLHILAKRENTPVLPLNGRQANIHELYVPELAFLHRHLMTGIKTTLGPGIGAGSEIFSIFSILFF